MSRLQLWLLRAGMALLAIAFALVRLALTPLALLGDVLLLPFELIWFLTW